MGWIAFYKLLPRYSVIADKVDLIWIEMLFEGSHTLGMTFCASFYLKTHNTSVFFEDEIDLVMPMSPLEKVITSCIRQIQQMSANGGFDASSPFPEHM